MKIVFSAVIGLSAAMPALPAAAQRGVLDEYCTTISENDKLASDGFALTDAGSIIRQDRANYHKFGFRDAGDQGDRTFRSTGARAKIPAMLERGDSERATLRQIVRGTPHICVEIYARSLTVYLD